MATQRRVITVVRFREYEDGVIIDSVTGGRFGAAPEKIKPDEGSYDEKFTLAKGENWRIVLAVEYDEEVEE